MKKIGKLLIVSLTALSAITVSSCKKPAGNTNIVSNAGTGLPREIPLLNEDSIQIHYKRTNGDYAGWNLWLWPKGGEGKAYNFNYEDDFGVVASYPLSLFGSSVIEDDLGFIIRKGEWEQKDTDADRFVEFSSYVKDTNGVYHVYILEGKANIYADMNLKVIDKINGAKFMSTSKIYIDVNTKISGYKIYQDNVVIKQGSVNDKTFTTVEINTPIDFGSNYSVEVTTSEGGKTVKADINKNELYSSKEFEDLYNYDGELGALYTKGKTEFKVWSPVATKIILKVYDNGTPVSVSKEKGSDVCTEYEMTKKDKGVFSCVVNGDLEGKYYTYTVYSTGNKLGKEIVDPYAKSCGINGLRGMIVDFGKTNPDGWDEVKLNEYDRKSLVVYETHVVDVTSSTSWGGSANNAKKYLGLIEEGTTVPNSTIKTGFDHIKELGVNAIQFQPIFDYQSNEVKPEFNWGYDPLNYNSLEGSYSSNPYDGYERIKEFKKVVQAYTNQGINVIMDVVYNHVNAATGSNFDVLCPGYYYRYDAKGALTNGSGCGNETASEHYMMRKFIVDSTKFWASEYKLGGFRFDLMGCHDVETMNEVAATLKEINEYITVYGEPWTGGGSGMPSTLTPATQASANSFKGYGAFNDQMRDALIKGGLSGKTDKGWITDDESVSQMDVSKIIYGMKGMTNAAIVDPNKAVNYVTCHDNYTLQDRIKAAGIKDDDKALSMAQLANSVVFTSQGTTFMLAGEEMYRTKYGDSNSYKSSYKINELDYSKLADPKIAKLYENYKALIKFKTEIAAMAMEKEDIAEKVNVVSKNDGAVIKATIQTEGGEYVILHANGTLKANMYALDLTGTTVMVNTTGSTTYLEPYQSVVYYKSK